MRKSLSPIFVIIVVVTALALGGLYFMVRYRANEARWAAKSQALQAQANRAMASGRAGRGRRAQGGQARSGDSSQPGRAQAAPESESQPGTP